MAKSVKGTQTEKNLLTSFAGESQARMRYTYFASVAKKEGYEQIAAIFTKGTRRTLSRFYPEYRDCQRICQGRRSSMAVPQLWFHLHR